MSNIKFDDKIKYETSNAASQEEITSVSDNINLTYTINVKIYQLHMPWASLSLIL